MGIWIWQPKPAHPLFTDRMHKLNLKNIVQLMKSYFHWAAIQLKAIHTPGHTLESTCYLAIDEQGIPEAIFTGDTLFVGDVGRPDLFSGDLTKEELAEFMYHSLHKLKALPDAVKVYPAHGPGSSCGKNLGPNTHSTIGEEKLTNYALQPQSKEEFVTAVTEGLSTPPVYFAINAGINKKGYMSLDELMQKGMKALTIEECKALKDEAIILEVLDRQLPLHRGLYLHPSV